MARARDRRGLVSGCPARLHPRHLRLLANELRLETVRDAAQRDPAVPHNDRRPRDPLPARALPTRRRVTSVADARLAGIRRRVHEGDRSARGSGPPRRRPLRCVRRRLPLTSRVRVQRSARRARVGDGPDRRRVGGTDGSARLLPLRGAWRGLGRERDDAAGQHRPGPSRRDPSDDAARPPAANRATPPS